ncbi:MAG: ComEC/Rec2 family competence protein, partial [Elioraea tepidiphila]
MREAVTPGRWIRRRGLDFAEGSEVLPAGRKLTARDIGLAAASNNPWLAVHRRPRIGILATGDEILLPGEAPRPGAIYSSNSFALAALATAPVGLAHFGRLQWYGVAANAIAVPLTSLLVMPAGMLAMLLMPFGLEAWPLAAMGLGVEGILRVAHWVAGWPGAAVSLARLPGWGFALGAFGLCWLCL